ncbi:MAG TPA: hypothetical protein ENJ18_09320 [Nannocystis exedens]|nr:hypothetical protein [Nannocystis exedens]
MRTPVALAAALSLISCVVAIRDPAAESSTPPTTASTAPETKPAGATESVLGPVGRGPAPAGSTAAPAGQPAGQTAGSAATPTGTAAGATHPLAAEPESIEEKHISTSLGEPGGLLIFWPRIIPRDIVDQNHELAAALQRHTRTVVQRNLPGTSLDIRPEPERVCPQNGCKAPSIGILLSREKQGCLVLALIAKPGESPTKIVPWAGEVRLKADSVAFREYPEMQITVADYVPCTSLLSKMDENEAIVMRALKEAMQ